MLSALMLLYLNVRTGNRKIHRTESILLILSFWTLYLYAVTELLSCFRALDMPFIIFAWGIPDLLLLVRVLMHGRLKTALSDMKTALGEHKLSFPFIFLILFMVILSVFTVPYNWDSMTYHLTRIAFWAQNRSVGHFATVDIREIASPVLAEFVNVNVYILCGKHDNLLNLLQTFSFIFNIFMVYRISRKLGISSKISYVASTMFACMPIAFAEALSTQVDEFAAAWLLIFVYTILGFIRRSEKLSWDRSTVERLLVLSISVAFGYLAKPSVVPAMLLFLLWMLVVRISKKDRTAVLISMILFSGVCIAGTIAPEAARNVKTFNALSSSATGERQLVGTSDPGYIFINGLKNYAFNLSNIYIYSFTYRMKGVVYKAASILGVNINDESIAEGGAEYIMGSIQNYDHDSAVNPVTVIFATLAFLYMLVRLCRKHGKRSEEQKLMDMFTFISFTAFIIFCLIVRWEAYVTRYMLAYLALLCVAVAAQLEDITARKPQTGYAVKVIIYFVCFVELWGLMNYHLKICYNQVKYPDRAEGYFYKRQDVWEDYKALSDYLNSTDDDCIGLRILGDSYSYPVWAMNARKNVKYVDVLTDDFSNDSVIYDDSSVQPDCIVCMGYYDGSDISYHGYDYRLSQKIGAFSVLEH